jgi:hypothetical protein
MTTRCMKTFDNFSLVLANYLSVIVDLDRLESRCILQFLITTECILI